MNEIAKRYAQDDAFREVADLLFGPGHSLVHKSNPAQSDISTHKKKETPEWQKNVALATNAGGAIAAPAAVYQATKGRKHGGIPRDAMRSGKLGPKLKNMAGKLDNPGGRKAKIAAATAGGTMVGLQIANAAGDTIAARMLAQEKAAKKQKDIHKSIKEIPESGQLPSKGKLTQAVAMKGSEKVVAAHKNGTFKKLPNKVATLRNKEVSKAKFPKRGSLRAMKRDAAQTAENLRQASFNANRATENLERTTQTVRRGAKGAAAAGVVGAGAGGYGVGDKWRQKRVKKNVEFDVKWEGEISKVDSDKRQVFGWASIVEMNGEPVVDLQGDYISIDEVEKSAYEYVHKSRKGGDMHLRDEWGEPKVGSHMIESFVVTEDKKQALGLPDATPTGWWVGYQVNDDDLWNKVKSGQRTGFSIHGRGVRSPM